MTTTSCTLSWHSDRGFELDLDATEDDIALRMVAVPVPVDGTVELHNGADLDRLDILFKAQVDVEEQPGQLQEVRVTLETEGGKTRLFVDAKVEDVETGDILPFRVRIPVSVPREAPETGGPRPVPQDEDELDWEDETTLEQMVVNAPETTGSHPPPKEGAGLQALLKALAELPEEDAASDPPGAEPAEEPQLPPDLAPVPLEEEPEPSAGDQSMTATDEARGLIELLIRGENLELEDGATPHDLAAGAADILGLPIGPARQASLLSEWLLGQDAVADLYIADDDLATVLDQW